MTPPKRLEDFAYRAFQVCIAQIGTQVKAIARNGSGVEVESISGETLDEVKLDIKARLNHLSQNFMGFGGAINVFLKAFPGGFRSDFHFVYERSYKEDVADFMRTELSGDRIDGLLATGDYQRVGDLAMEALVVSGSNLCFLNERLKLADALKIERLRKPFAESLRALLYGDFEHGLDGLVRLLKSHDAAKWPILTYWPFFRFPDRHMFLKPEMTQNCAERMGYELDYESSPNPGTYRSLLGFTAVLRQGIAELEPRDNIDLQTFIYVVTKRDYVREAIENRGATAMAG